MFKPNSAPLLLASLLFVVIAAALLWPAAFVASPGQEAMQKEGMGVSTGAARTYSSRRTTGITDSKAPVVFEDVTARTALARFRHRSGGPEKNYILETPSGGVAIFDYDG